MSLQRERIFILLLLLGLVAASWAILIWQSRTVQGMDSGMGSGLTMGMGAALFLTIWVVMMVPSAVPVILAVARVQHDRGTFSYALSERLTT